MAGGFVAVSFHPSVAARARDVIDTLDPHPPFTAEPVWSPADGAPLLVRTWRRVDGRNRSVTSDATSLTASFGADVNSTLVAAGGRAEASADPLGYGGLFTWKGRDIAAIATRVELLAQLAAAWGDPATKDTSVAELMASIGFAAPGASGYVEVRGLDPDEVVHTEAGGIHVDIHPDAIEWDRTGRESQLTDLVAQAAHLIVSGVTSAVDAPAPVVVDLTAGADSHLMLGGLLRAGLAKEVEFQTIGPAGLHDVQVASARAAQLGLRHRSGYPYPFSKGSLWERFVGNARLTSGLNNPKDGLRERFDGKDERRLCGLHGELLRGWRTHASQTSSAAKRMEGIARGFGAGHLALLHADAAANATRRIHDEILDASAPDRVAWHAAHRYYARNRLRSRALRLDDLLPESRVHPIFSKELVEIGLDAMWHHPDAEFADLVLEYLHPGLKEPPPAPVTEAVPDTTPSPAELSPASFMQMSIAVQSAERAEVFARVAATESQAWETIDRAAFRSAVADYEQLRHPQLHVLHGAATAVLWLSDLVDHR